MANILVIEDDIIVMNNISEILQSENHEVTQAESAEEGLKIVESQYPDLIVSDIQLSKMDGYDFLKTLRGSLNLKIPFIFLTAKSQRENVRQGMNLGADDYLSKPFTAEELIGTVNARLIKKKKDSPKRDAVVDKILDYLQGDLKKEITPLLKHSNEAIEYFPENPDVEFFELLKTVSTCSKDISEKASKLLVYIEVLSMKNRYKSENLIKNGLTKVEKSYFQYFMLKHNEHKNRADDINIYFEPATVRIDKKNLDYVIDEFLNFMLKTTDSGKVIRCAGIKIDQHYLIVIKENRFDGSILKEEEITCFGALAGGECSLHRCSINLLVAKKIIEMNGGELTVGTKNGDNKMFRIKLNLANEF